MGGSNSIPHKDELCQWTRRFDLHPSASADYL